MDRQRDMRMGVKNSLGDVCSDGSFTLNGIDISISPADTCTTFIAFQQEENTWHFILWNNGPKKLGPQHGAHRKTGRV